MSWCTLPALIGFNGNMALPETKYLIQQALFVLLGIATVFFFYNMSLKVVHNRWVLLTLMAGLVVMLIYLIGARPRR